VGVAELSAGRVAWARDAEAMSRLGDYSDFLLKSRIAGSPRLMSIPLIRRLCQDKAISSSGHVTACAVPLPLFN